LTKWQISAGTTIPASCLLPKEAGGRKEKHPGKLPPLLRSAKDASPKESWIYKVNLPRRRQARSTTFFES